MTTEPTALLRRTEAYLSALHGSVARHDNLAANLACAGCELRDEIRAALAAEAPTPTKPETPEDPARIDRLRPEFTEHSSVEAIDAQLRRSRAQERRWHIRTEWLISLRADRVAQKARGEWPAAAGVRQDGAQQ
jgi:hypothetical protein